MKTVLAIANMKRNVLLLLLFCSALLFAARSTPAAPKPADEDENFPVTQVEDEDFPAKEVNDDDFPPKQAEDEDFPPRKVDEKDVPEDAEDEEPPDEQPEPIYGPVITDGLKSKLLAPIIEQLKGAPKLESILAGLENIAADDSDPEKSLEAEEIIDHINGWGRYAIDKAREDEISDLPAAVKQYRSLAAMYEGMDVGIEAKERLADPGLAMEAKAWPLLAKVLKAEELLKSESGGTGRITPRQCMEVISKATGILKDKFPDTRASAGAQEIAEGIEAWATEQIEETRELETSDPAQAATMYRSINAKFGGAAGKAAMARFQDPAFKREMEAWNEYTTKFLRAEEALVTPDGTDASVTDGKWERKNQFKIRIMISTAVAIKKRYPDTAAWRKIEATLEDYDIEL